MFHITAVDLYGNTLYTNTIPFPYSNTPDYYKQVTDKIKEFIAKISMMKKRYLVFPSLHKESPPLITLLCCMET